MATLMDKHFNVRIKLRNDSWTNWEENQDFVPYDGEIIIYDIPTQEEARTYNLGSLNYQLIKIGDGVKSLKELPAINEMTTTLNIATGSKPGTISVAGADIYVNGLKDSNIMCFEPQSKYATIFSLNQLNTDIVDLEESLNPKVATIQDKLKELEIKIDSISDSNGGSNPSDLNALIQSINDEKIAREDGDKANKNYIDNKLNDYTTIEVLNERLYNITNGVDGYKTLIASETSTRTRQVVSIQSDIANINERLDSLGDSSENTEAGKVSLIQKNNIYTFYQNDIEIGSIEIPEDNFLTSGLVSREGNDATIQLYTKESEPVLIDASKLINIYKAQGIGEKIQLSIDSNNIISASIIDKSITNEQLSNGTILEENLHPDLVFKINNSSGGSSSIPEEQFENLKNYIDESVNLETGVISGKYGNNDVTLLNYGSYFNIPNFTVNAQGKLTQAETTMLKLPSFYSATGETNGTVIVNGEEIAVKGLGSAAFTNSTAYDSAGTGAAQAQNALASAKEYANGIKDELLNGAGAAYDTLKELGELIDNNTDAIDALETIAANKADANHTHNYAGSSSIGGAAISANKLNANNGSANQPVYFNNGIPVAISYTINKSVPADAKFTDTTYEDATQNSRGLMTAADKKKLDSLTGVTADTVVTSVNNKTGAVSLTYSDVGAAPDVHTHNYAGSSSAGGAATSANKLNTNNGSTNQPVYFNNGIPVAINYSINKSVPADAVFTDTTYSNATQSTNGLMAAADKKKLDGITAGAAVTSVNGKTGAVSLTYSDVGAISSEQIQNNYLSLTGGTLTGRLITTDNGIYFSNNNYPQLAFTNTSGRMNGLLYYGGGNGGVSNLVLRNYYALDDQSYVEAYLSPEGGWYANSVWGAVYNDYAEFRSQNEYIKPGYVAYCDDDGKLKITTERLQKFEGVVSDTFGFSIGKNSDNQTPIAVSGRVLVYGDEAEHFHSGDCVCAGPEGKVYRMTREEIIEFPDRIVGVVSEIPTYKIWGTSNVEVNNRIWIKVR